MSEPSALPEWATSPTAGDVVEPIPSKKASGWRKVLGVPEKPPYQQLNWWMNLVYQWTSYFKTTVDDLNPRMTAVEAEAEIKVINTDPITDIQSLATSGIDWSNSSIVQPIYLPAPYNYWFVPVYNDSDGKSSTSSNGITWTTRTNMAADRTWTSAAYSPSLGRLCVVSRNTSGGLNCQTSDDGGITWTNRTSANLDNKAWRGVAWSPSLNLFVAVGTSASYRIATSPDGITWTIRTPTYDDSFYSIDWSPSLGAFVAIGLFSYQRSTDGTTWSSYYEFPSTGSQVWQVKWISNESQFFVSFCDGTIDVSTNGLVWSRRGKGFSTIRSSAWIQYVPNIRALFLVASGAQHSISYDLGFTFSNVDTPLTNAPWHLVSEPYIYQIANSSDYSRIIFPNDSSPGKFYAGDRFPTSPVNQDFYLDKLTGQTWRYFNGWKKLSAKLGDTIVSTRAVTTWTARSASAASDWRAVCYSRERKLFVAVASLGTGRVMTSVDGVTWTGRTEAAANGWYNVVWAPELGLFVSLAFDGSTSNNCMTSPDGVTWTSRTTPAVQLWYGLCWSPKLRKFVAVSADGASYRCMISIDGTTWVSVTSAVALASAWSSVCWSHELSLFVAVATSGTNRVMTSPDGITWTARSAAEANSWRSVTWSPELGLFVAVASDGTNRVMTSPDGTTWTARSAANAVQWWNVTWAAELGLFVAVAIDGTTAQQIMTSPDGFTWTARTSSEANSWRGICWAKDVGLLAAVSQAGTNRVMNSTFVGTIPTF